MKFPHWAVNSRLVTFDDDGWKQIGVFFWTNKWRFVHFLPFFAIFSQFSFSQIVTLVEHRFQRHPQTITFLLCFFWFIPRNDFVPIWPSLGTTCLKKNKGRKWKSANFIGVTIWEREKLDENSNYLNISWNQFFLVTSLVNKTKSTFLDPWPQING